MIPTKPFDTYKWRWFSVQPTESLLIAPVFLGVLRALARHEGKSPAAPEVAEDLRIVQIDTKSPVDLARTPDRNLVRNSGQYWKGTGLLLTDSGVIRLSPLGRLVATGEVTQTEFAALMVQQTVLPNPWTYSSGEIAKWRAANLEVKPLSLILQVMSSLGQSQRESAFVTPAELIQVVIPLAGARAPVEEIADYVLRFRRGDDFSNWPDCAPEANDHRLAREFLLFLANFGVCRTVEAPLAKDVQYWIDELPDIAGLGANASSSIFSTGAQNQAVADIRHSDLPSIVERQRAAAMALKRTGQSQFRDSILRAYSCRCLLSGEVITEVLEAAHIVPVKHGGADVDDNGVCLRVDLHRLFDSGHIRWRQNGDLVVSRAVSDSVNYRSLPSSAVIPGFVNPANVRWRDSYL